MYKVDLNNPQWLICHKNKPNQTKPKQTYTYFLGNILNKPEFICLYTVKWFQVLLCNINNSI